MIFVLRCHYLYYYQYQVLTKTRWDHQEQVLGLLPTEDDSLPNNDFYPYHKNREYFQRILISIVIQHVFVVMSLVDAISIMKNNFTMFTQSKQVTTEDAIVLSQKTTCLPHLYKIIVSNHAYILISHLKTSGLVHPGTPHHLVRLILLLRLIISKFSIGGTFISSFRTIMFQHHFFLFLFGDFLNRYVFDGPIGVQILSHANDKLERISNTRDLFGSLPVMVTPKSLLLHKLNHCLSWCLLNLFQVFFI